MKIGICQMQVHENKQVNLDHAAKLIKEAVQAGAEVVALPEMFNCPYQKELFPEYAETQDGESVRFLSNLARVNKCIIVGGSIPERDGSRIYNTAFVFDREGRIIAKHRKIHLFDVKLPGGLCFQESAVLSPGAQISTFTTKFGPLAVVICYDIRFPELFRMMATAGVFAVIIPANFNPTTGAAHWELLFRARAVDNQIYTIGIGQARNEYTTYHSYGHSIAVDPWGEILWQADEQETIGIVTFDSERVTQIRNSLPLLQHRRMDLYGINP